jgi:ubiquitin-activating enzyme E1 C
MLMGTDGIYSYTFEYERRPSCAVCGGEAFPVEVKDPEMTLESFIEELVDKPGVYVISVHT